VIVAVCAWKIDRKAVLDSLEQEIELLIGDGQFGCFVVTLNGPMGSDDALKIEPNQSNYRLEMSGGLWSPFALDIALDILKNHGQVRITGLPDGLVRHFLLESTLREWSTQTFLEMRRMGEQKDDSRMVNEATQSLSTRTLRVWSAHHFMPKVCLGCEKDDRREWTEPDEHSCGRQQ
jgi:hypothetical protein